MINHQLTQRNKNYDTLYQHSTDNQYYVYVYLDPRKPGHYNSINTSLLYEPFYVGKGKNNRYRTALSVSKRKHPFYYKISKIRFTCKKDPYTIIISTFNTEDEAFKHEELLITHFSKQNIPLTNIEAGGKDARQKLPNPFTKSRKSKLKNIPRTNEVKQKISEAKKQWHPTSKRWLVISPEGTKYTPISLCQLMVDQLGYTNNGYKVLINAHLKGRNLIKQGIMKGWQIYELT